MATTDRSAPAACVGTHSGVVRWVDAHVAPLELLDEFAPGTDLRRMGQGFLGWCAFHDDQAADHLGRPGTRSFYVVHNHRYGWSWRCLSTNCVHQAGPMRHAFRLWQDLQYLSVADAMRSAVARWPAAGDDVDE